MSEAAHTSVSFLRPMAGTKGGIASWLFSTDHKRIGIMYLCGIMGFFLVGLLLGFLVRLELIAPGPTIMDAQTYNTVFTLHGVIMIFLVVIPSIPAAFGNIILPIQIGAEDVSFPKLNNFSFWLYVIGALMALSSLFTGKGGPDTGWTFYVPFSQTTSTNVSAAVLAVFVLGFSSILTGLNFITTIHRLRAPGMTWDRLPLFVWSLYATGWIQVLATPVLGITVLLIFAERVLGVGLFDPSRGGRPPVVPASLLDILAPGGLHHDSARHGRHLGHPAGVRPQEHLRLQDDSPFQSCHSLCRFTCMGAPHVHQRHE